MKTLASTMMVGILFVGLPASAITIGAEGGASGSVKVGGDEDTSINLETKAKANVNAKSTTSDTAHIKTNIDTDAGIESELLIIKASGIDADADLSIKSPAAVQSKTELASYARNVAKANADLSDVILSDTEVSVTHREYARIFWIFPVKVSAQATVTSDGNVTVTFPWYVFAGAKSAELEAKVKAAVHSSIPTASATAQVKLSAQAQAQVLEEATAAMKSQLEADASA